MNTKRYIILGAFALIASVVGWKVVSNLMHGKDYLQALPEEANAIARIDLESFAEKHFSGHPLFTDVLTRVLARQTGIRATMPFYAFYLPEGHLGMVCAVNSRDKLVRFLQEQNAIVESLEDCSYTHFGGFFFLFDDEKLVAIEAHAPHKKTLVLARMKALMQQKSTPHSALFRVLNSLPEAPMNIAFRGDALPQLLVREFEKFLPQNAQFDDLVVSAQLTPKDNGIDIEGSLSSEHQGFQRMFALMDSTFSPLERVCVCDTPMRSPWYSVNLNADGTHLLSLMRILPKVRLALLALNMCIDADLILSSVQGPVLVRSGQVGMNGRATIFTAHLRDTDFLNNSSAWDDNLTSGAIAYERLDSARFFLHALDQNFWFGAEEKHLYVSTHKDGTLSTFGQQWRPISHEEKNIRLWADMRIDCFIPLFLRMLPKQMIRNAAGGNVPSWRSLQLKATDSRHFSVRIE